jgi:hypothetical protein
VTTLGTRRAALVLGLAGMTFVAAAPAVSRAQAPAMDPQAVKLLERMTSYLGGLKAFSVDTQNTFEDILDSGQKIQYDVSARGTVLRPNKMRAERRGDLINQVWYYDGKTLTLYDTTEKYYATVPAPGTIEEMLDFAREKLGLIAPAGDLLYRNAFPLLMRVVTSGIVVGKAVIDGVKCDHLAFTGPAADLQVWIPEAGPPLPRKYVVTDKSVPAQPEYVARLSNWNTAPKVSEGLFTFVPPPGAKRTEFLRLDKSGSPAR